tara:strand:- start:308 stop:574 length:267 start_codon:yes stop_codon:yes gene_type:complete
MHVKGKTAIEVEIEPKELVSALKKELYSRLNLPDPSYERVYIKDERWVSQRSVYTTHSFEIEEDLGPAIEDDIELFDAFHTIAEFLRD